MGQTVRKNWASAGLLAAGLWTLLGWAGLGLSACVEMQAQRSASAQPFVDKLVLNDTIQPVSADEVTRALDRANSDGAQALLIEMDTPGGLLDSMRTMVGAILRSRVPVIVFVAPSGSRAGSAGFFLLESADVAAMAPGTEAGAAHVVFEGGKPDDVEMQKVENDAEAFMRSYVTKRGRSADAAQEAEKSSHSYTADESLNQHLIDLIANNDADLLQKIDGRTVTRMDGSTSTLHVANARIVPIQLTLRDRLLGWLVNPNIALLFLVFGALLIYLEFNSPGTIVPGALGTLMVLLAIFALDLLPIRYTAVLLLVAALVLLILEAKFGGHGALAIAGILCLTFGTLTLVAAPVPEMGISPWERGIWRHHVVSGAAGGAGAQAQGAHWCRGDGGRDRDCDGSPCSRGPCSGGGRNLASRGECAGGRRSQAARGGARAFAAESRTGRTASRRVGGLAGRQCFSCALSALE